MAEAKTLYCANHPDRETLLRCAKCGKPICVQCSVRHPVGLRCKECAQVQKSPIYNISIPEYGLAAVIGLVAATVGGALMGLIGGGWGWYLGFILGPVIGGMIAEAMHRPIRLKRGRGMQILAGACIVVGTFVGQVVVNLMWLPPEFTGFASLLLANPRFLPLLLSQVNWVYIIFAVGTAMARLR